MDRYVKFKLPCGCVVDVPKSWVDILPLFGCHDFCPEGGGYLESGKCEAFRVLYEKWLASGVDS